MIATNVIDATSFELLGVFIPGGVPKVHTDAGCRLDEAIIHETSHKQLCDATVYGQYLHVMGIASKYGDTESVRSAATNEMRELVACSWFAQEGFATFSQWIFGRGEDGIPLDAFLATLPASYTSAFETYNIFNDEEICDFLAASPIHELPSEACSPSLVCRFGRHFLAEALSGAAMSVPLRSILESQESLPSTAVAAYIRLNNPDRRLKLLRNVVTLDFLLRCFIDGTTATIQIFKDNKARAHDEAIDALSRTLAAKANVPYEAVEGFPTADFIRKAGCHRVKVNFENARDIPLLESHRLATSASIAGSKDLIDIPSLTLGAAQEAYADTLLPHVTKIDAVVCEVVMSPAHEPVARVMLHCFHRQTTIIPAHIDYRQSVIDQLNSAFRDSPVICAKMPIAVPNESIASLRSHFECSEWYWLLPCDWLLPPCPLSDLEASGELFWAVLASQRDRFPKTLIEYAMDISNFAVPPTDMTIQAKACLSIMKDSDPSQSRNLVMIQYANHFQRNAPYPIFKYGCVGAAMLYGYINLLDSII